MTSKILSAVEILQQSSECRKQSDWRTKEEAFWHKQQAVNKALAEPIAEEARRSLFTWLAPVSSDDHHDVALNLRFPGTCAWVLDAPQFNAWAQGVSWALWIHGITGAGKTVLTASIIKFIQENICPDEALSYFYFDHTNSGNQDVRSFLATIIVSLAGQNTAYLEAVLKRVNNARAMGRLPSIYLLQECFAESLQYFATLYIVVDAIDEYSDVKTLMEQLLSLGGKGLEKVKLLVTSRTNTNIEEKFAESQEDYLDGALASSSQQHGVKNENNGVAPGSQQTAALEEIVHRFCEEGRMLWKLKRNRKKAFEEFFYCDPEPGTTPAPESASRLRTIPSTGTAEILTFLNNLKIDTNALDRAGCTPLYWAYVRSWTGIRSHLESLGGELFASPKQCLDQIRASILELLHGLNSPEPSYAFASTPLDLSRKWDWTTWVAIYISVVTMKMRCGLLRLARCSIRNLQRYSRLPLLQLCLLLCRLQLRELSTWWPVHRSRTGQCQPMSGVC